jgi:V-type H+-transporting ATPase proteolipid subunit
MGITNPDAVMKNILPVVMAGILGIYGLIISVMIVQNVKDTGYALYNAYAHLAAGLACGLSSLASGLAIGIVGDSGVRAAGQNEKLFVPMALILIFAEALGMYGLIVGILISSVSKAECTM